MDLHALQVSEYDQYWVRRDGGRVRVTRDVGGGAADEVESVSRETTESGRIVFPDDGSNADQSPTTKIGETEAPLTTSTTTTTTTITTTTTTTTTTEPTPVYIDPDHKVRLKSQSGNNFLIYYMYLS